MNIDFFIRNYGIQAADAIVVKKEKFGILDHYVIYMGKDNRGEHKFIANYTQGVKLLHYTEILHFLKSYIPVRINRFTGNPTQRQFAVNRALSKLNETAYHLILNNCEHFASWVQRGIADSKQVENTGKALAIAGVGVGIAGLAKSNGKMAGAGLLLLALGMAAVELSNQD